MSSWMKAVRTSIELLVTALMDKRNKSWQRSAARIQREMSWKLTTAVTSFYDAEIVL
jgi:hypothetical protein